MAVVQVSQIQVRRGFLEDLGQLTGGEFGWGHDQLRLFIGNGTIGEGAPYEGNTEILTQHSLKNLISSLFPYTFKGLLGGYAAQTGTDALNPVIRSLQDKLDDHVNVKDFGAVGDGVTNDLPAIQRAIDEIYDRFSAYTDVETRRIIDFYPGTYVINGELRIPPYCTLRGTTSNGVTLVGTSSVATCLFKTTNSLGHYDATIPSGGLPPGNITVTNIEFRNNYDVTIGKIESATQVKFSGCRFIGPRPTPNTYTASAGVVINSSYLPSRDIYFDDCDFAGVSTAAAISEGVLTQSIRFNRCTFSNLYRGITAFSTTANIADLKITNSVFNIIDHEAIEITNYQSVTSSLNTFMSNVGRSFGNSIVTSVIKFGGNLSYSMGDVIMRDQVNDAVLYSVNHIYPDVVSLDAANALRLGHSYQTLGKSILAQNNTVNYIPLSPKFRAGVINYNVQRGTNYRSGTIHFAANPATNTCDWRDSYSEMNPTGIEVQVEFNANTGVARPMIVYTTDNSGNPSAITYDVKSIPTNIVI